MNFSKFLKGVLLGQDLKRDLARHQRAADALDRVVKEMLEK